MIYKKIDKSHILEAKKMTSILDNNKTWNKIKTNTNYIGALGELMLYLYLNKNQKDFRWVPFNKTEPIFTDPDFYINKKSVDLKTSYSRSLWFQKPIHDIYIHAHITNDDKFILFDGYITKEMMIEFIGSGQAKQVKRGSRIDYVISQNLLLPIEDVVGVSSTPATHK